MTGISIQITRDTATPLMDRIKSEATQAGLSLVMGRAVGNLWRDWLYDLNAERHKHGRNYYAQAADSVTVTATPDGVKITASQIGFRQRRYGGEIRPKGGRKYLTIPATPEAYGRRAGEFGDLDFAFVMDENGAIRPALVRRASTLLKYSRRKRKDGSVSINVRAGEEIERKVYYWLVKKVTQQPDPSVLPPDSLIVAYAREAAVRRIARLSGAN